MSGLILRDGDYNDLRQQYCPLGFWQTLRTRCKVSKVGFTDLGIGSDTVPADVPFFTRRRATLIIEAAREPFKTLFAVPWCTGLRAGEILALTLDDLDFTRRTVRVNKSSDDRTREIRQPKTEKSVAVFPMNTSLEAKPTSNSVSESDRRSSAFTRQRGTDRIQACLEEARDSRERRRAPRLATELAEAAAPLTVLQQQLRHADIKTTLKLYST